MEWYVFMGRKVSGETFIRDLMLLTLRHHFCFKFIYLNYRMQENVFFLQKITKRTKKWEIVFVLTIKPTPILS